MKDQNMRFLLLLLLAANAALAEGERAGEFDYYVLSLSWSPAWCALDGDDRGAAQCAAQAGRGWILHGLWPQYHRGWPSHCRGTRRPPSRALTAGMADVMGSSSLAWYQWKKHGTCTGLSAPDYYALARQAFARVTRPAVFRKLDRPVRVAPVLIEQAFLKANPGWKPDMLTITCRAGRIQEARLCLSKGLEPVPCGRDVVTDCRLGSALLDPVR